MTENRDPKKLHNSLPDLHRPLSSVTSRTPRVDEDRREGHGRPEFSTGQRSLSSSTPRSPRSAPAPKADGSTWLSADRGTLLAWDAIVATHGGSGIPPDPRALRRNSVLTLVGYPGVSGYRQGEGHAGNTAQTAQVILNSKRILRALGTSTRFYYDDGRLGRAAREAARMNLPLAPSALRHPQELLGRPRLAWASTPRTDEHSRRS
jgi:hypothetical protein